MFVQDLATTSQKVAKVHNRRTLAVNDIKSIANSIDQFYFLKDSKLSAFDAKKEEQRVAEKEAVEIVAEEEAEEGEEDNALQPVKMM